MYVSTIIRYSNSADIDRNFIHSFKEEGRNADVGGYVAVADRVFILLLKCKLDSISLAGRNFSSALGTNSVVIDS